MAYLPTSNEAANRILEAMGGADKVRKVAEEQHAAMQERWSRNVEVLGRVLRAHLFVEHYLAAHIQHANPRLGDIASARLSFFQKLDLLDQSDPMVADVVPGVRHLNAIRNRFAHLPDAQVTEADASLFFGSAIFKCVHELARKTDGVGDDPVEVLEVFAQYASSMFDQEFSSIEKLFSDARVKLLAVSREQRWEPATAITGDNMNAAVPPGP